MHNYIYKALCECDARHTSRAPNCCWKFSAVARSESGELSKDGHRPSIKPLKKNLWSFGAKPIWLPTEKSGLQMSPCLNLYLKVKRKFQQKYQVWVIVTPGNHFPKIGWIMNFLVSGAWISDFWDFHRIFYCSIAYCMCNSAAPCSKFWYW